MLLAAAKMCASCFFSVSVLVQSPRVADGFSGYSHARLLWLIWKLIFAVLLQTQLPFHPKRPLKGDLDLRSPMSRVGLFVSLECRSHEPPLLLLPSRVSCHISDKPTFLLPSSPQRQHNTACLSSGKVDGEMSPWEHLVSICNWPLASET